MRNQCDNINQTAYGNGLILILIIYLILLSVSLTVSRNDNNKKRKSSSSKAIITRRIYQERIKYNYFRRVSKCDYTISLCIYADI